MANPLGQLGTFFLEIREEMKQVAWPGREELLGSALVVFVGVLILGTFVWACDIVISKSILDGVLIKGAELVSRLGVMR